MSSPCPRPLASTADPTVPTSHAAEQQLTANHTKQINANTDAIAALGHQMQKVVQCGLLQKGFDNINANIAQLIARQDNTEVRCNRSDGAEVKESE